MPGRLPEGLADAIAVAQLNGTAYQGPATVYGALVTTTPTADTPGTEVALVDDATYERLAITQATFWGAVPDVHGTYTNAADADWIAATGAEGTIVAVEFYSAATEGTRVGPWALLAEGVAVGVGQYLHIPAGELTLVIS